MSISLEKKLEQVTLEKKRYRSLFRLAALGLGLLLFTVYYNLVMDYAVLDNVKIQRQDDVLEAGRIDFNYGQAVLTDRKPVKNDEGFNWTWDADGATEVSIRSRKWLLPHWDSELFNF